ncbi:hypothetical protein N7481_001003 [Penicillium waksmanii]|uniref:uncharacterized protein n=1 Tax=Penicillium waksmanii TaxID=69791 RepID=UPI002548B8B3|nr:uncharacterized protein N7481_001003 [Penicillium waksmanii]KAJ6000594.1 hypothetical protein N7481_001003 [Penicillium waksmanii]
MDSDSPPSRKRPRPRPVVSCLRCRDKKLKCDRATPCQNCIKAVCIAECTYSQHPAPNPSNSPDHSNASLQKPKPKSKRVHLDISEESDQRVQLDSPRNIGIIEDLQRRVLHLEELAAVQPNSTVFGPLKDATIQSPWPQENSPLSTPFQGTLVIKGSRSRYHGQNNRISLLNQFPDAKAFINQCGTDSSLVGLAKEVQFLQSKCQIPTASPESLSELESFPELQCLLDSLPPKPLCDHLVDVYTKSFEKALRIVHVPSFLRHYSKLWDETLDLEASSAKDFVPLLMAVLTVTAAVLATPPSTGNTASWRYLKETAPGNIRAWLKKLPRKQRTEITTLQAETLLLLSCQLHLADAEELWKTSGELVRSAMVMGLHISTDTSTEITPFRAECRKRLWITIAELDLQMSISSGMPVMIPELDFKALTPANLNDSDFDETTTTLPSARDLSEETDSLFQIYLAASLSQRIKTMNMAQHTNPQDSLETRWKQKQTLEESFEKASLCLERSIELGELDSSGRALNRVMLNVFLHRPLLALLQPVVTAGTHNEHLLFPEIQQTFIKSSLSILSYQDYFDPNISGLGLFNLSEASWETFQALFHQDILSAALNVCKYMRYLDQASVQRGSTNHRSTSLTLSGQPVSRVSLIRLVENTLETLTRRISERGTNVKDILLLSVVLQSARGRGTTTQQDLLMSQGARKALSSSRQYLLSKQSEEANPFSVSDIAQMPHSPYIPMGPSHQLPSASNPTHLADLFEPSSALAAEFSNFESDLFALDDGSFLWNL